MAPGQSEKAPVFRFAPSPNGLLHLGHALSALTNQAMAQRLGGQLLLRIEDIDPMRCRPEFVAAIEEDLAWLGLRFAGEIRRQSDHLALYRSALRRLEDEGLVYPCFCSRQEIRRAVAEQEMRMGRSWPADPDSSALYPGACRALTPEQARRRMDEGAPYVLRLDMAKALARTAAKGESLLYHAIDADGLSVPVTGAPARWGDVVLARKDTPTSYHLSVVVDDALQGVSHVVRGRDLEAATDVHALLQRLLDLPTPLYHFHPLLTDEAGQKLAKSRGSESLADLRARGVTAAAIRRQLGFQ